MQKWEYVTVPLLVHATKQILDNWGDEGWELVSVVPGPNPEQLIAYMKREKKLVSDAAERLAAMGLTLPRVVPPVAAYVPAIRTGGYVYTSGQLPVVDGKLQATGKVGESVSPDEAVALARICALNALAAAAEAAGGLACITRVVKVTGFVASVPGFTGQAQVINGASEFLIEVLGEAGRHARSAVGMAVLPLDSPVEVEMIVEVSPA